MLLVISITSLIIALYMMKAEIVFLLKKTFGFCVVGEGFNTRHYTFTYSEAVEWAACYDNATITQRGNFVASKTTK